MKSILQYVLKYISFIEFIAFILSLMFFHIAIIINNLTIKGIVASISASFFFLFFMEFIENNRKLIELYKFKRLFGSEAIKNEMYLVYPDFELNDKLKKFASEHKLAHFEKSKPKFSNSYRIDLDKAVADNDLRALIYLTGLFGEICKRTPKITVDSKIVEEPNRSFISFGLTSNDCTHMYLVRSDKPAFQLVSNGNEPDYLAIYDEQGQELRYESSVGMCYGIIVKYHPDAVNYPNRIWMYCAGLGPDGTTGAAWYLSHNWETLYKKVGTSDFVAIIKVLYSDKDPIFEHYVKLPNGSENNE